MLRVSEDVDVAGLFERYMRRCHTEGVSGYHEVVSPLVRPAHRVLRGTGVRKAGHVTVVLLEDVREMRADEGASDDALYRENRDVKMVWRYGEERNLIPVNYLKTFKLSKPPVGEQRCYSNDEVKAIVAHAGRRDADIFTVLAFTGMRRAELQWLTWRDVDLENDWLHVRAKEGWRTKNRKGRKLPIHPRVREVLQRLPQRCRWMFPGGAARRSGRKGTQLHVEHLRERLQVLLKELGFEPGGLHAFRRFFISHCANQGVPPTVLMRWVGHADLRMIIRYYTLRDDESQEAMDVLRGGAKSPGFKTVLRQTGVPEKQLRSQRPDLRIVTTAS